MQKSIYNAEKQEIITMNITGASVTANMAPCMTRKTTVTKSMAMLLGIDAGDMEIAKPIKINQGVSITIYIYANDKNVDLPKLLNSSNETSGELGNIFKEGWNLSNPPTVSDVKTVVVESKETIKNRMEMEIETGKQNDTIDVAAEISQVRQHHDKVVTDPRDTDQGIGQDGY